MKELRVGEVFMFLGSQYIVSGYRSFEGVIDGIEIWPFPAAPNDVAACNAALGCPMAEPTCPVEQALKDLKSVLESLKKVS